jgi:hypothetical protein
MTTATIEIAYLTIDGVTTSTTDLQGAMKALWEAKSAGKSASMSRTPPAPAPTPAGQVSSIAARRVAEQEAMANESGFRLPPPLFTAGTRVLALGDQNFKTERRRVEDLPRFDEAAGAVIDAVRAENREDLNVRLRDVSMSSDGRFAGLPMTEPSFRQLCGRIGTGYGAAYLSGVPSPRRADNVNADITERGQKVDAKLRTRQGEDGEREIFAVLSQKYATVDADQILRRSTPPLMDARGEITYDGERLRATALWMPDHIVDLSAGDVFKAGVRITSDDTGGGAIKVEGVLFRNRCLNLIIIGEARQASLNQIHLGNRDVIAAQIRPAVERARAMVAPFLAAWGLARTVEVADPMEALRALVYGGPLAPDRLNQREGALAALRAAFDVEPGRTRADLANAITRAAHESDDLVQSYRDQMERYASRLIMAPR